MKASHAVFAILLSAVLVSPARARELSLAEALKAAKDHSPRLKAARLQETAAREAVGAARSYYYPSIAADAVDSWGFPGSSGYLGLGGLVGSSYRSGPAADLVARQTLLDFGRTAAEVDAAKATAQARRAARGVDRFALDQDVLQTFYECSRFRSDREIWASLHDDIALVSDEVTRFVNTGQRSVVDRYLSRAQVEEARTNRNFFKSRMYSTADRLALLMGTQEHGLECPPLPPAGAAVPPPPAPAANPYLLQARAEADAAQARVKGAEREYLPKVVGVASVGAMDKARVVPKKDYSGGLGLIVPLFDGLGTRHRVARARAERDASAQQLAAVELQTREADARYDEIIAASKARLEHLQQEQKLAEEGFRVAKSRYFKFQGTLVDLRDALRNLGRIETDLIDTQANLLEASGSKALLNAGSAPAL